MNATTPTAAASPAAQLDIRATLIVAQHLRLALVPLPHGTKSPMTPKWQ